MAAVCGGEVMRDVPFETFLANIPACRKQCGDRDVLRAFHFYADNDRVPQQVAALREGDLNAFLQMVTEMCIRDRGKHAHQLGVEQIACGGVVLAHATGNGIVHKGLEDAFQIGIAHLTLRRGKVVQLHGHKQLVANVNFIIGQDLSLIHISLLQGGIRGASAG